jgi:hypothetical protein
LNDVLSFSGNTQVNEDDSDKINVKDCDGDKDESIDEEETILINLHNTNM